MWIVAVVQSFEYDTPAYTFAEYNKAKAYLHKLWQDCYNTEIAENSEKLDEQQCFHEDEYAKVTWLDGDKIEFILTYNSPYDKKFFEGDWKRYL